MNRPAWCALLFAPIAIGCRSPTQIKVTVGTDVACANVVGTSFTSGELATLEATPVTSESESCAANHLGSVVLVPSGSDDAVVGFKVVTSLNGRTLDFCNSDAGVGDTDCIVARRALRYLPHTPLDVLVTMEQACEGVVCDPTSTCAKGACVPATIDDPSQCAGSGCGDNVLGDAGADATVAGDAAVDASPSEDAPVSNGDAGGDSGADEGGPVVPPSDGGGVFSPATDCDLGGTQPGAAWPQTGGCANHRNRSGYRVIPNGKTLYGPINLAGAVHRAPTIAADGTIVLAEEGDVIQAFNPDGGVKWTYMDPATQTAFVQPPTVAADGTLRAYDDKSGVYVTLDLQQGTALARQTVSALSDDGVARVTGGIEYLVNNNSGSLEARTDGGLLWTGAAADDHVVPAVAGDHSIVVTDDTGTITRVYPDGGTAVAKAVVPGITLGGLAISASTLLAADTTNNDVNAYDLATLATRWSFPIGGTGQNLLGFSVADDGATFAGTHQSGLVRIEADGGSTVTYAAGKGCSQPAIDSAGILVLWCNGSVQAITPDLASTPIWSVDMPKTNFLIPDTPVIAPNGQVYFTAIPETGSTYALYFIGP